ncbi:MAG: hypothetical protein LBH40_04165 [Alphaproteobacteria bacterium]|jgi:hypothetical protein|nr:hypothetical protein [Alphaproteobacteria bacterium]
MTKASKADVMNYSNKNFQAFAKTFLSIRGKENTISKLALNKEQKYIHEQLQQQKKNKGKVRALILKGRQIGATTYVSSRCYHYIILNRGAKGLVMCHHQQATNNIFDMIKRYYKNSPCHLLPKKTLMSNYKHINFQNINSSYAFATAGGLEVGRSDTIQFFHGSEVSFWKNSDNHLSSILMSVPDNQNTEVILESTSNGANGLFYNMCMEASREKSEYELIFLPWYWHSEYVSANKIDFSYDWLEYQKLHKLSREQLTWAYLKNQNLCANNLEDISKPSNRFHREFPATIHEAFMKDSNNKLIPFHKLLAKSLQKNFLQQAEHEEIKEDFRLSQR